MSVRPQLNSSNVQLRTYGGTSLKVLGEILVMARLQTSDSSQPVALLVVEGEGPNLLGRDLLSKFSMFKLPVFNVSGVGSSDIVQAKFSGLFSPGLGCLKDLAVSIEVDNAVPPKFCKARPVPNTLKTIVDEELDRLIKEEIIQPVTNSRWAAAIVPVLKPDQSVRICGDYKLTVNKAARLVTYPIPKLEDLFSQLAGGAIFTKLDLSQPMPTET